MSAEQKIFEGPIAMFESCAEHVELSRLAVEVRLKIDEYREAAEKYGHVEENMMSLACTIMHMFIYPEDEDIDPAHVATVSGIYCSIRDFMEKERSKDGKGTTPE